MCIRLFALLLLPFVSQAQNSELYLFDFRTEAGELSVSNPRYISGFNTGGYNNQASFVNRNEILLAAAPKSNPEATDLFLLNLRSEQVTQITKTVDREYSPTVSVDGQWIHCVVVEVENENKQVLWKYPMDRSGGGEPIAPAAKNVGYYTPINEEWVAVFEVGEPHQLYAVHLNTGERKLISTKIGRSIAQTEPGKIMFVHKYSDDYWMLKEWDLAVGRSSTIKKTLPGSEDFTITGPGKLIMASGAKIYELNRNGDNQWIEVADLEPYGLDNITRMAYDGLGQLVVTQ